MRYPAHWVLLATALAISLVSNLLRKPKRPSKIPKHTERVLILGATSGIGREIAHQYAKRGARICIVGRRENLIDEVVSECQGILDQVGMRCLGVRADFSNVEEMVRVRGFVEEGAYERSFGILPF